MGLPVAARTSWLLPLALVSRFLAAEVNLQHPITDRFGQPLADVDGVFLINEELGVTLDTSLIHTFQDFNVNTGGSANFVLSSDHIQNIVGRVIGTELSRIDGAIQSDATLWLMNPNGFVFFENASFDVNGSLYISSADEVIFSGSDFRLNENTDLQGISLAIGEPVGFGFLPDNPGLLDAELAAIRAELSGGTLSVDLSNAPEVAAEIPQRMMLAGAGIRLGQGTFAPSGPSTSQQTSLELVSIDEPLDLYVDDGLNQLRNADLQSAITRNEFTSEYESVSVISGGALSIRQFSFGNSDGRRAFSNYFLFGNDVQLNTVRFAAGQANLETMPFTSANSTGSVPGVLEISANQLNLESLLFFGGEQNQITNPFSLHAYGRESIQLSGFDSYQNPGASDTKFVFRSEHQLSLSDFNLRLEATENPFFGDRLAYFYGGDSISLYDSTIFISGPLIWPDIPGETIAMIDMQSAGSIAMEAATIEATGLNVAQQDGPPGGILITGSQVDLQDTRLNLNNERVTGNSSPVPGDQPDSMPFQLENTGIPQEDVGDISITASGAITLAPGTEIVTNTEQLGDAGDIRISGASVSLTNAVLRSDTLLENLESGNGGSIVLAAGNGDIVISENSDITSSTFGQGQAGSVTLLATNGAIILHGSGIRSESLSAFEDAGSAGTIELDASSIALDDALVVVSTSSNNPNDGFDAGIVIRATDGDIIIKNDSSEIAELSPPSQEEPTTQENPPGQEQPPSTGEPPMDETPPEEGGDGTIQDGEEVVEAGSSLKGIRAETNGTDAGGSITIENLNGDIYFEGGVVIADSSGPGNAGELVIVANNGTVSLSDGAFFATTSGSSGNAGTINITGHDIHLSDSAVLSDSVKEAVGNAGAIQLTATGGDLLAFTEPSESEPENTQQPGNNNSSNLFNTISSTATGTGNAREIKLSALNGSIELSGWLVKSESIAEVDNTEQAGDAGLVRLDAENITLNQSSVNVTTQSDNVDGNPANIELLATEGSIELGGGLGSNLLANTFGAAPAGNIELNAETSIRLGDFHIRAETESSGSAGNIELLTPGDIVVSTGGQIESSTLDSGTAGTIRILNNGIISMDGSGFEFSTHIATNSEGAGRGGNIEIQGAELLKLNDALIVANASEAGNAGSIAITNIGNAQLFDQAAVQTESLQSGGGNIRIAVRDLLALVAGKLSASAGGDAQGGNVDLTGELMLIDQHSSIEAKAQEGQGGAITLKAKAILRSNSAAIDASSDSGNDGTVEFQVPELDNNAVIVDLSIPVFDVSAFIDRSCEPVAGDGRSSFVIAAQRLGAVTDYYRPSIMPGLSVGLNRTNSVLENLSMGGSHGIHSESYETVGRRIIHNADVFGLGCI